MESVFYLTKKILNRLADILNDYACRKFVLIPKESMFKRTARVDNLAGIAEKIVIGKHTIIRGELVLFRHGGRIEIGDFCYIGEGTRIWSSIHIAIGDRVLISHGVNIHDNNSHPIEHKMRHEYYKTLILSNSHPLVDDSLNEKKIIIEDDAWIGFNAIILKGVRIGAKSIIAAGTLVSEDVPPNVIFAGNPGRVIKRLQ